MSSAATSDPSTTLPQASKSKRSKKKKGGKGKLNGDHARRNGISIEDEQEQDDVEGDDQPLRSPTEPPNSPQKAEVEPRLVLTNGTTKDPETDRLGGQKRRASGEGRSVTGGNDISRDESLAAKSSSDHEVPDSSVDADKSLDALLRERSDLQEEIAQVRKSLEEMQAKHEEEVHDMRERLAETEDKKEQAETKHQNLLGKINGIRSQLGDRLRADAEDLSQARNRIDNLEQQCGNLREENAIRATELAAMAAEAEQRSRELSTLRNRTTLSQQNWSKEKDDLLQREAHAKEEFESAKQAMHDWEVLAMEERSIRESLADKVADLEEQSASHREAHERAASERDAQSSTVDGLQRALQDIQNARKHELREVVENSQAQTQTLQKKLREVEGRAADSTNALETAQQELERALPFEKEVKEKNLLIGKLRHEAVILNDHLTKALRYLKKGKPEDTIDKQLVTNHILHFLALERADPKKFQVLQIIANLLAWTEEQREQAGLSRPGASNPNLRVPISPWHRTPSTPALSSEFFPEGGTRKESLTKLWSDFLEQEAQEGDSVKSPPSSSGGSRPP